MKTPTKGELVKQVEKLEVKLVEKENDREDLRLKFVEARKIYEQMEIEDAIRLMIRGKSTRLCIRTTRTGCQRRTRT